MKYVCIWLIRFYQKFLSPLKRNPCCRFYPTCSAYALEAFTKRGFFVGFGLSVWRILRCQPFCPGGYDPVPPKKIPKYQRDRTKEALVSHGENDNDDEKSLNDRED